MRLEVTSQCETFVALRAMMWLLPGVEEHMVLEVGHFAEASAAHCAPVRPRAVVDVLVRLEVAWGRETLAAQLTFVWLFLKWKASCN